MLKQRFKAGFFGSKAYQVIVSAAFGIGNRDVDPVRENLPTVYEVTGGKDRMCIRCTESRIQKHRYGPELFQ